MKKSVFLRMLFLPFLAISISCENIDDAAFECEGGADCMSELETRGRYDGMKRCKFTGAQSYSPDFYWVRYPSLAKDNKHKTSFAHLDNAVTMYNGRDKWLTLKTGQNRRFSGLRFVGFKLYSVGDKIDIRIYSKNQDGTHSQIRKKLGWTPPSNNFTFSFKNVFGNEFLWISKVRISSKYGFEVKEIEELCPSWCADLNLWC